MLSSLLLLSLTMSTSSRTPSAVAMTAAKAKIGTAKVSAKATGKHVFESARVEFKGMAAKACMVEAVLLVVLSAAVLQPGLAELVVYLALGFVGEHFVRL